MLTKLMDPEYWRSRAEEARAQADQMHDESTRQTLLGIADNYDQLAGQAEARLKSKQSVTL